MLDYSRWRARCGGELRIQILDKGLIGGETLLGTMSVELSARQFWQDPTGSPEVCTFAVRGDAGKGEPILPPIRGSTGGSAEARIGERSLGRVVGDMVLKMRLCTADHR